MPHPKNHRQENSVPPKNIPVTSPPKSKTLPRLTSTSYKHSHHPSFPREQKPGVDHWQRADLKLVCDAYCDVMRGRDEIRGNIVEVQNLDCASDVEEG
jgi:hypothetical protein